MVDSKLYSMLDRLFKHAKSMRKYQRNSATMSTNFDKTMARRFEMEVDKDISNIDSYLRNSKSPSAPPPQA